MTPSSLLNLLFAPIEVDRAGDLGSYLRRWASGAPVDGSAFAFLVHAARPAGDRVRASAAGHQAAIRRLFPDTPDGAIAAFCVSEEQGPRPSSIRTSLTADADGVLLNGSKRWGSLAPLADLLYVAASIGEKNGRNQLRMVAVPASSPGLTLDRGPYLAYADHLPLADLHMADVRVPAKAVSSRDAYDAFIKPFRLIEDVYGTAATQIGLLRLGRDSLWPDAVLEDLTALILQAFTISQTPMAEPEDVIVMAAYFRASEAFWDRLTPLWAQASAAVKAGWSPEKGTLRLAAKARETRRLKAWAALGVSP